jgi:hypothetical protein
VQLTGGVFHGSEYSAKEVTDLLSLEHVPSHVKVEPDTGRAWSLFTSPEEANSVIKMIKDTWANDGILATMAKKNVYVQRHVDDSKASDTLFIGRIVNPGCIDNSDWLQTLFPRALTYMGGSKRSASSSHSQINVQCRVIS